jgi:AraC-like DNA-binding protein/ligand-binding sensor protein
MRTEERLHHEGNGRSVHEVPDPAPMLQPGVREVIDQLCQSRLFTEYHQAYGDLTGLPLALRPHDYWQLPLQMCSHENEFCAIIGDDSQGCAACLKVQAKLTQDAAGEAQSITCPFGLIDMAVPVYIGSECQAFLFSGQFFLRPPTPARFRSAIRHMGKWRLAENPGELEQAYTGGKVLKRKQINAVLQLLTHFSGQLSEKANRILQDSSQAEPTLITQARQYLLNHHSDPITLTTISDHLNVSTFYFCKQFKKHVGTNFTDYLTRLRIEHTKRLLRDPKQQISEIAFAVGFRSLPHFNRSFKRIAGQTPTEFREDTLQQLAR